MTPARPPYSAEMEQAVLGAVLLQPTVFADVGDLLTTADFYRSEHRLIFEALTRLDGESKPIDVLTVGEALKASGDLEELGGLGYLSELARNTASAANARTYAQRVRDLSLERQALACTMRAQTILHEAGETAEKIDQVQQLFTEIGTRNGEGPQAVGASLPAWMDRLDYLYHSEDEFTGLPTSYADLDNLTSGLQPGDLVIVAARPSMGKTALAMNVAEHTAVRNGKPVLVFSLEMPTAQLISRLTSSLARIPFDRVRNPKTLREEDWPRMTQATTQINKAPLYIDDSSGLSPMEMRARARRVKQRHGCELVIVDYLQLMQVPGYGPNQRTGEISEISRSLKAMAKELGVPVIALSQLNRGLEQRQNKRPIMSDLRESGAIEQDADLIVFIYRDEVYTPAEGSDDPRKGMAELVIGKQRNGPLGTVNLAFRGEFCRFDNSDHSSQRRYAEILKNKSKPTRNTGGFSDL